MKRGVFFTVDALLAAAVLLGGLVLLSSNYVSHIPNSHLNYLSQDILNTLSNLQIGELDNDYVDQLIAEGNITDLNKTVLEQIGIFWAEENYNLAYSLTSNVTEGILPEIYGFGIWIDDEVVFKKENPPPFSRSNARKLVSGIEKAQPVEGYIAKARAATYFKNGTYIVPFHTAGAGWYGSQEDPGEVIIDKYFDLQNVTITNALFYISVHIQSGGPDYEIININNGTCTYNKDDLIFIGGDGTFDTKEVTGCLQNGVNHIKLRLQNLGYNAHIHPGMLLKVDYTLNGSLPFYEDEYSNRYYFDNVLSLEGSNDLSGAWQMVPFHIPEDAENVSVSARIVGKNILDSGGNGKFISWSGKLFEKEYDYIFFINGEEPFDHDNHPDTNPIYEYTPTQLNPQLVEGTNLVAVYFNNYGDYTWGGGMPEIYSDPINDPENSSYIEVNYTVSNSDKYGTIEVSQVQEFGGNADSTKQINFSFPAGIAGIGEVFTHIVQQYSYMVDVDADAYNPPSTTVFSSPAVRAVPTNIYIPKTVLESSPVATNYIKLTDLEGNPILPYSAVEYSFYVRSIVGYGDVFATLEEAELDAQQRLNETLGDFIYAGNIVIESDEMTDVPTMWGPAKVEVKVWH